MSLLSILCSMIGRNDEENMYAGIVPFWMMLEKDLVASSWTWRGAMYRYSCKSMVNPLHPNISMKILHTVLLPFLVVLLRRNFLMITSFISWLVTLMFHLVLDSSHSWGWKDWSVSSKLEFATDFAVVIGQNGQQNGVKNMGHYPYFCGTTQYVICLIFTNPILKKIGLCFSNLYLWYPSLFNIRFFSPHKWSCDSP